MKKKILLPTDFSKNAWNAIAYAIELYKNEACDFYILHAFQVSDYAMDSMMVPEPGNGIYEEKKRTSEKEFVKIMKRLSFRDTYPNHKFYTILQHNNVLEAIKDVVEKKDIEMIIMGTQGTTSAKDIIYGSNTVLVMEKERNCPVMAIPEDITYKEPKEIVFPTDYKINVKHRELKYLIELASISNASIRILHIAENDDGLSSEQEENKKLLEEYFEGLDFTFHTLHNIDVKSGLSSFVESRGSDIITFINKKHSFFGSIFSRPMVKDLGHHARVPVLALHDLTN
ncbi:universal stress protein [Flavobacteriaceae bacterium (ex Bugula neritina AB1)]|nr:universal stress protein [Flavobacteriaceae bacterium (ex Bugula neritina AB1)]